MWRALAILGFIAGCVGCDQGTKRLALQTLNTGTVSLLSGRILLHCVPNSGAFGGMGAGWPSWVRMLAFVALPLAILVPMTIAAIRGRVPNRLQLVAYLLIVSGGLGNIVDRVVAGSVVDFMYIRFVGPLATNIFNVADVAVMAGAILLLIEIGFPRRRTDAATEDDQSGEGGAPQAPAR